MTTHMIARRMDAHPSTMRNRMIAQAAVCRFDVSGRGDAGPINIITIQRQRLLPGILM